MADEKPAGQADTKPAGEEKPGEQKPAEQKPAEQKPAGPSEEKPAAQKPSETAGKEGTAKPESKAPAKYELQLPDGGRVDASDLKAIEETARTAGWSNEEAQAAVAEFDALVSAQSARFLAETKADETYGGDKLEHTQQLARAVIDRIRPTGHPRRDAFHRFMNRGGAGNHLEVVSFLADLGKLMAEDGVVGGSGGGGAKRDAAEILYGTTTK
jgi:hypothetical protein